MVTSHDGFAATQFCDQRNLPDTYLRVSFRLGRARYRVTPFYLSRVHIFVRETIFFGSAQMVLQFP